MIVYDLSCDSGHVFEGWFGSSGDFTAQMQRGLIACPTCGSDVVGKAPMAPAVGKKGNQKISQAKPGRNMRNAAMPNAPMTSAPMASAPMTSGPMPAEVKAAIARLAEAQAQALKDSKWVGSRFAEESRKIHYGESKGIAIHGQATLEEASALIEEGIAVAPLPLPIAPPDELN